MRVIWYVPNIIDYFRIMFLIVALYHFETDMNTTLVSYSLSTYILSDQSPKLILIGCLMDIIDGFTARIFKQISLFGGVLDMVTDRMSGIAFIIYLAKLYKQYTFLFSVLLYIDIMSHWM